jgi:hypothetical protein
MSEGENMMKTRASSRAVCFLVIPILALSCTRACRKGNPPAADSGNQEGFANYIRPSTGGDPTKEGPGKLTGEAMVTFASAKDFDSYAEELKKQAEQQAKGKGGMYGSGPMETGSADSPAPAAEKAEATSGAGDSSITNVQEAGVDEGDIVKVYGDYLVVLRRGRIFSVHLRDQFKTVLQPVSKVDAYPQGFSKGGWYDEMLIYKNRIVVVGYSYAMNATEIGLFQIDEMGRIRHLSTHFVDSNDYYSSRNYASRLVDGNLVFYMPYYMFSWTYEGGVSQQVVSLPKVRRWTTGNETTEGKDLLSKTDVYRPVQPTMYPTLHTVARCNLESDDLDCSAKAVLGPYSRTFYVSPDAIYVWVSPEYYYGPQGQGGDQEAARRSFVYRFSIEDFSARGIQAYGTPIDQFSFKESEGALNIVVRESGAGDAMWNPEFTGGKLALIRAPLRAFSARPQLVPADSYTTLPTPTGYTIQNRFVGDHLLYGSGSGWYYDPSHEKKVYVTKILSAKDVREIPLSHSVDRIEVMGKGAVVIGASQDGLTFSAVGLGGAPEVMSTYTVKNAVQGELRSHGFFFKSTSADEGILGLPIRKEGASYMHLFNESAEVLYLRVGDNMTFSELGSLVSKAGSDINDSCVASCVDWYGNSRPIFIGDRVFALMGYELVEGTLSGGAIKETRRISFFL